MQGNVQVQRISSGCFGNNLELSFVSIFCMHVILGLVAFFIPSLGYLYSARWLPWWTSRARPFLSSRAQQQPVAERQLAARDSAGCQRRAGVDSIDDAGRGRREGGRARHVDLQVREPLGERVQHGHHRVHRCAGAGRPRLPVL